MQGIEGLSDNPHWVDLSLETKDEKPVWNKAIIKLSDEGLEILQNSNLKNWKIEA